MSDAIEVSTPTTPKAILTREALKVEAEQRQLLSEYIAKQMVEKVDYGKIPGTDKPTLLKPGAEKLVDLFRCTPKFALIKAEEDFERGHFNYIFRVRLYQRNAGAVLAEGFGSCNSREGRYRWRDSQRTCPNCKKAMIIKGKAEYGGGWVCFAKKGGCGAKFKDGDASIEGQRVGRVENDDVATLANTILKMAKKRALVDGAIALARCSDLFTQDVEDIGPEHERDPLEDGFTADNPPPHTMAPPSRSAQSRSDALTEKLKGQAKDKPLSTEEAAKAGAELAAICKANGWTWARMTDVIKANTSAKNTAQLTMADVEKVKVAIQRMKAIQAPPPGDHPDDPGSHMSEYGFEPGAQ